MEMDVKTNHDWNCTEDESTHPEALGLSDAYREPELLPRIGDKFQVEIPPLLSKSAYLALTKTRNDSTFIPCDSHEILVGLPISLMWINDEKAENMNGLSNDSTNGTQVKVESLDVKLHNGIDLLEEENDLLRGSVKGYRLVPGSVGGMWSDVEEASFILSVYIFGKNFVLVNKFIETKDMGELLSFYYGRFYKSDKYKRWAGCRKIRSRRCIYGHRIFSGSSHQELLSRLYLHVSEDCQNTLTKVGKAYSEGKVSLEEYVFALKAIVGLNTLIEAVGIGKGKQDLTGMAVDHPKPNQSASARPEIPIGKACSTLSPLEITNFLTGGYRLSKARSNDLFWEAVWPRLLARGWHSEQPRDHCFARNSLVFLVPGVKKFSRRKLVKGDHYFDSITDVLNKVASDPGLLELDAGADNGCENDFPDKQRHCYLKPRTPSRSSETMKFTVVDTSLSNGEESKVRELRSFPVEIMDISEFKIDSEESDGDSSGCSSNESGSSDEASVDQSKTNAEKSMIIDVNDEDSSDKNSGDNDALKPNPNVIISGFKVPSDPIKEQKIGKHDSKARSTNKTRTKDGKPKPSAPAAKRRRLTACERTTKQDEFGLQKNVACDRTGSSSTDECTFSGSNSAVDEHLNEKPRPRFLIDLNIPPPNNPQDMDDDEEGKAGESAMNSRRQSTRNRPPTTKALEALACGFLSIRPKKHSRDGFQLEGPIAKPSRRARSRVRINGGGPAAGVVDFEGDKRSKSNGDMVGELQV